MAATVRPNTRSEESIELVDIAKSFSFSNHLAGIQQDKAGHITNLKIVCNGELVDPVHLITLGLSEEGRGLRRGCFYHLPLRQDINYGHPCDLVFIDEGWSDFDCETWDEMNWEQRLGLLLATSKKIRGGERVIPICARILSYGHEVENDNNQEFTKSLAQYPVENTSDVSETNTAATETSALISGLSIFSATTPKCNANSDPTTIIDISSYSRPIEDLSSFLVHYKCICSTPLVCMSRAAEYQSICTKFPTRGDVSETFIRNPDLVALLGRAANAADKFEDREMTVKAVGIVLKGHARTTLDVVMRFLAAWNDDSPSAVEDRTDFGPIKYLWDELQERIDTDRSFRDISVMDYWPKAKV